MKQEYIPKVEKENCSKCGKKVSDKLFYLDHNNKEDFYYNDLTDWEKVNGETVCSSCCEKHNFV